MHLTYDAGVLIAVMLYLCAALLFGFRLYHRSETMTDYVLGSRSLPRPLVNISAFSADMSAWIMLAVPGLAYRFGIGVLWIGVGLALGVFAVRRWIVPRLRAFGQVLRQDVTLPQFLESRSGSTLVRLVSVGLILIFSFFYITASINAGGKLLESIFGLKYAIGILIMTAVLLLFSSIHCFLSMAKSDLLHGFFILFALLLTPIVLWIRVPEAHHLFASLKGQDAALSNLFSPGILGILSALSLGLGYLGVPFLLQRYMASGSVHRVRRQSPLLIAFTFLAVLGAVWIGLVGRVDMPNGLKTDMQSELVMMTMITDNGRFASLIAGFLLSGIFAAILSTATSLLHMLSSVVAGDILPFVWPQPTEKAGIDKARWITLLFALPAMALAFRPETTIHSLVMYSWNGFGAVFGPLLLMLLYRPGLHPKACLAGMITGFVLTSVWSVIPVLNNALYPILPGFLANLLVLWLSDRILSSGIDPQSQEDYLDMLDVMRTKRPRSS